MEIEATQAMDANCDSDEEDDMPRDKRMVRNSRFESFGHSCCLGGVINIPHHW